MKTKLLFAILFLVCFPENTFSQEYHPFLNNSSWVVSDWVSCCRQPYIKFIAEGTDVVMGDFTYKKFIDPLPYNAVDTVYIREDIAERKVYRHEASGDVLIYDFSLENGDSVTLGNIEFTAATDDCAIIDDSRKRITLTSVETFNGHHLTQVWIEGVGSPAYPFYPDRNMYNVLSSGGGVVYTTRCEFQNQQHVYGNPDNCLSFLENPDNEIADRGMAIAPNPFSTQVTLTSSTELFQATFRLYTMQGQLVREIKNIYGNSLTIDRGNLSSGMYFGQLSQDGQILKASKLTVD